MGRSLIALYPILYESKQYSIGENIPVNNNEIINEWIKAGAAKWNDEESNDDLKAQIEEMKKSHTEEIEQLRKAHECEISKLQEGKEEVEKKLEEALNSQAIGENKDDSITKQETSSETQSKKIRKSSKSE